MWIPYIITLHPRLYLSKDYCLSNKSDNMESRQDGREFLSHAKSRGLLAVHLYSLIGVYHCL